MKEQAHGGDRYGRRGMLDFSENVNPLGLPEGVKKALIDSVESYAYYPDPLCRDLTSALAAKQGLPAEWLRFGGGAADLIYRVALGLRPKRALTLAPTFSEYEFALRAGGCALSFHRLREETGFRLTETVLDELAGMDLAIICNPNNPTGQPAGRELLLEIAKRCGENGCTLLVDECFVPFLDAPEAETLAGELHRFPNVMLLGAFTKIYAMAGLRLGYLYCADPARLDKVSRLAPPWNISAPAQAAGLAALAEDGYLERTRELIQRERPWLAAALASCGAAVTGSKADYIFFKCNREDLAERLEERGILIRSCANYRGLDGSYFRVGVKTRKMNEALIAAVDTILKGA